MEKYLIKRHRRVKISTFEVKLKSNLNIREKKKKKKKKTSQVKLILYKQIQNSPPNPALARRKADELLLILHLLIQRTHHK